MTTVRWSARARTEFVEAIDYISLDRPLAAEALAKRISDRIDALKANPLIGRPGRRRDTREFIVSGTPFLVVYRAEPGAITILRFLHGRRLWPPA